MGTRLIDRIVETSGLSPVFGLAAMKRALTRAGVNPETTAAADLEKALPEVERALSVFMTPDEVVSAMRRVRAIKAG